ncbi:outer membrane beta-barrel family protein [Salegentibacter flavus]|uniref:Outer membrane receptor proteins, mostly Fe transport n=1 Tax=Salegentibacter flavus TaxID=287099 RepID=A0A1I5DAY0_9FLAO|nr:outer membrane beta-barrel family protein [Salegentibacter flavus]SFN96352.1 Outer membrane receptor proteins, mostly Fe transport [Salegentibacter flavus]
MKELAIIICLIFSLSGFSQNKFTLYGNVENEQNENTSLGQAYLLNDQEQLINFSIVENGNFSLSAESGTYRLKVEVLNYEIFEETIDLDKDQQVDIKLESLPDHLDEVQITAKRKTLTYKDGNININVENSVFETLSQTKDVLAKLPKVQISPDGEELQLLGQGTPLIYLGNQQIQFQELNSIPVTNIRNIEIINNPGAQYEADGTSVIVVHLKNNLENGFNVSLTETASFKRRFNNYASTALNYRKNKFALTANFEYNRLHHWESNQSEFTLLDEDIYSRYKVVTSAPRPQFVSGLNLSFDLDEDTKLSTGINFRTDSEDFPIETETFLKDGLQSTDILTLTQNKAQKSYLTSQLNFNKSFSKEQTLFLGGQYSRFGQDLQTEIYNSTNQQEYEFSDLRDQDFGIKRGSMRVDYENKLNSILNIKLGANLALAKANAYSFIDSEAQNYGYEESVYASYADLSGNFKNWEYRMGLRIEESQVEGNYEKEQNSAINRNNLNWLPSIQLNYSTENENRLSINYKRSLKRPNYSNASSITGYLNPFLEFSGNINLKPTYNDEVSLNYQWKKLSFEAGYYAEKDPVYYSVDFNEEMERLIMSPNNLERENGMYLELAAPVTYKFLTSTNTLLLAYSETMDAAGIQAFEAKPFLYYYSNNEFDIIPKTQFAINFWGQTTRYEGIYKRNSMFIIGASFSRTIFEKLQVSLNFNDLFQQMNYGETYQINNIHTNSLFFADGQEIAIGLKYSFGKKLETSTNLEDVDEELERLK